MTAVSSYINNDPSIIDWNLWLLSRDQDYEVVSVIDDTKTLFDEFKKTITSYSFLNEDWDSYGSERVSAYAIQNALDLVDELEVRNLDIFHVSPSPIGGVTIELDDGNRNIEIDFSPTGETEIAYYEGDEIKREDTNLSLNSLQLWLNL